MSTSPNQSGYTKPQPVILLGAIVAGLTATLSALTIIFKDNATVILVLGVVGAVVTGITLAKDQFLKEQVVPFVDTATYVNQEGVTVAGPASSLENGTPIGDNLGTVVETAGLDVKQLATDIAHQLNSGETLGDGLR